MRQLIAQMFKFAGVGFAAFLVDYVLLIILTEIFGINYLISATVSYILSILFNYLLSMRIVFKRKESLSRGRAFILFVVFSIIGLLLNDILMFVGTSLLVVDYRITKIVVTAIVGIWNFGSRKLALDSTPTPTLHRRLK